MVSIVDTRSSTFSFLRDDLVVRASGVVFFVSSTVGLIEIILGDSVPESVSVRVPDVASSEVWFVSSFFEGDYDEISVGVVVFKVKAFEIAVVPRDVGIWNVAGSCLFGSSVPVIVTSTSILGGGEEH